MHDEDGDDVKAQRRATELVLPAGVKADDEANSVVSASTAAGRGAMVVKYVVMMLSAWRNGEIQRRGRWRSISMSGRKFHLEAEDVSCP